MRHYIYVALVFAAALAFLGCPNPSNSDSDDTTTGDDSNQQNEDLAPKGSVELAHQEWSRSTAITVVTGEILEELGWDVTVSSMSNEATWQAVANGSADAMLAAWLPNTHSDFYGDSTAEYTGDVEDLGANYEGAHLGLVVPSYVDETTVAELSANAADYDSTITGIDPGAGMMDTTQSMIEEDTYSLGDWTLTEGSGESMLSALGTAIANDEPIVVTGWRPHPKFIEYDLRLLEDPQGVYGTEEDIHTIVRTGLEDEQPQLYEFLTGMEWSAIEEEVVGAVMLRVRDGDGAESAADAVVAAQTDLINSALPAGLEL